MTDPAPERLAVLMLNFGEPDEPSADGVTAYLERIFLQNMRLESAGQAGRERARALAERRAPGLLEAYERMDGSPLDAQARAQAAALERALGARGRSACVRAAFQFTEPFVAGGVAELLAERPDVLVALPVYPLCGQSTTVAALDDVSGATAGADIPTVAISGWHAEPAYVHLRADHIADFVRARGLDLRAADTLLYFSVHGTPIQYLDEGNRYDRYVEEHCRAVAERLEAPRYEVGFQNHANRGIPWTQPDNERALPEVCADQLVVVPISFMHEQSETLVELDVDLAELAAESGKTLHRVPVPHDDPRFAELLTDVVERAVAAAVHGSGGLARCRCRPHAETWCTNGDRDLPPSPYAASASGSGAVAAEASMEPGR